MNEILEQAKNAVFRQSVQGVIALLLTLALCYVVVFGESPSEYKDLFAYAVAATLGFYFGRETKTTGEK